ncbi:metallophosphoesterase [Undibacterium arcticum]
MHLEFLMQSHADYRIIDKTDADVLVLAGDIHNRTKAIEAFRDWPVPVVYVHGNHEFYGQNLLKVQDALRVTAAGTNVHYLENDEYVLNGVRFLGCCLWTDYELTGDRPGAMFEARYGMRDHEVIRVADGKRFMPSHALALHKQSRKWLAQKNWMSRFLVKRWLSPTMGHIPPRSTKKICRQPCEPGILQ